MRPHQLRALRVARLPGARLDQQTSTRLRRINYATAAWLERRGFVTVEAGTRLVRITHQGLCELADRGVGAP